MRTSEQAYAMNPFWLQDYPKIYIQQNCDVDSLLRQMRYRVVEQPDELMRHLQRIYFSMSLGLQDELFGSLLDLMIATGGKGRVLQARLLLQAKACLPAVYHASLMARYKNDSMDSCRLTWSCCSLLQGDAVGAFDLIERSQIEQVTAQLESVLDEARELADYGQFSEATALLTAAILDGDTRETVIDELLLLFSYSNDREGYAVFCDEMAKQQIPLPTPLRSIPWRE